MSNFVVASFLATAAIPSRLVGHVSESKDGIVTIEFKEAGMVKTTTRTFHSSDLLAYMPGDAGFVIAMVNDPVAKVAGGMAIKGGQTYIMTEAGNVRVNRGILGAMVTLTSVEEGSKEARAADRAAKVKVRGSKKSKKDKGEKTKKSKKSKSGDEGGKKKKKKKKSKSE